MLTKYTKVKRNNTHAWIMFLFGIAFGALLSIVLDPKPESEVIVKTEIVYVDVIKEVEKEEVEEPVFEPRYGFTDDDIYLMTVLLCGSEKTDGDGEYDIDVGNYDNHREIGLVLGVVMNRVMSSEFPNTVSEVIWAKNQFTPMRRWVNGLPKVSERSYQIVKEWCEAYDAHDLSILSVPENHLFFSAKKQRLGNVSRERWR